MGEPDHLKQNINVVFEKTTNLLKKFDRGFLQKYPDCPKKDYIPKNFFLTNPDP